MSSNQKIEKDGNKGKKNNKIYYVVTIIMNKPPNWGKLPALVITDIFKYLSFNDRINASSICWDWRYQLFQPR